MKLRNERVRGNEHDTKRKERDNHDEDMKKESERGKQERREGE